MRHVNSSTINLDILKLRQRMQEHGTLLIYVSHAWTWTNSLKMYTIELQFNVHHILQKIKKFTLNKISRCEINDFKINSNFDKYFFPPFMPVHRSIYEIMNRYVRSNTWIIMENMTKNYCGRRENDTKKIINGGEQLNIRMKWLLIS